MHAVVITVNVSDPDSAITALREDVVPRIKGAPGFVAGYWTRDGNNGLSMVVFESEDQARQAAEGARDGMPEGVELQDAQVREVVANA